MRSTILITFLFPSITYFSVSALLLYFFTSSNISLIKYTFYLHFFYLLFHIIFYAYHLDFDILSSNTETLNYLRFFLFFQFRQSFLFLILSSRQYFLQSLVLIFFIKFWCKQKKSFSIFIVIKNFFNNL